jgi:integrase
MKNINAKAVVFRNSVVIDYSNKGKNLRFSTGITGVDKNQLQNNTLKKDVYDYKIKNQIIHQKLAAVNKIINEFLVNNAGTKPTIDFIKNELNKPNQQGVVFVQRGFNFYFKEFYDSKKQEAIVKASLKDYMSTYNALIAYDEQKEKLTLDNINSEDFLKKWEKFLSEPVKKTRARGTKGELNNNTIAKRRSSFKTFMRWLDKKGYIVLKPEVLGYKSRITKYQPTIVILETEEIEKLLGLKLKGKEEKLRDFLIFSCYTGLRFSDLITLGKSDISEGFIVKYAEKTRQVFKVPIKEEAMKLFEKHNYSLNMFSTKDYNESVKKLLEKYSICDEIIKVRKVTYSMVIEKEVKKHLKISSHTGRRTFIAECIKANCSIPEIMGFTGHRSMASLQVYVDKFQAQEQSKEKIKKLFSR